MKIKIAITQVVHGEEYHGTIGIAGTELNHKLKFGVPISQLEKQVPPKEEDGVQNFYRQLFQYSLRMNGVEIAISDEMFGFLTSTVGRMAIDFYNNPQTRDYNSGVMKTIGLLEGIGVEASIGTSTEYDIPNESLPKDLLRLM